MLYQLLTLACAIAGFLLGAFAIGSRELPRSKPRYLMVGGAAVFPIIWLVHPLLPGSYSFDMDVLMAMTGVGLLTAGWEAEAQIERTRRLEDLRRLKASWDMRSSGAASQAEPLATETGAFARLKSKPVNTPDEPTADDRVGEPSEAAQ